MAEFADPDFPANHLHMPRSPLAENAVFLDR